MGRTFLFSCYVAVYRCAVIIQIMRYAVKVASPLTIFGISKGKFQRLQKTFLYLLGRFQEKYQRAKNNSVQLGQNFQNPFPTKLVGSLKPHFCPSWTEVEKLTSTQVVSKSKITSTQLAERSWFNFYSGCVEVEFASRQKSKALTLRGLRLCRCLIFGVW